MLGTIHNIHIFIWKLSFSHVNFVFEVLLGGIKVAVTQR